MKLREVVDSYTTLKRALGASFKDAAGLLAAFSRAIGDDTDIADVSLDQVRAFVFGNGGYSRRKYNTLTGFYRYAVNRGYASESPLPSAVPKSCDAFIPYIYTRDEVRRLLEATSSYRKTNRCLEPHTFRTILLLLYGAGLRVGEALSLTLGDVDLQAAVLTIRNTKFNKTRLVPVGPDLQKALIGYVALRDQRKHSADVTAPFFIERAGTRIPYNTICHAFQTLRAYAQVVRADGLSCHPRLHDLRHTFALHRLISWYRAGADVQKLLPQLSTYMGHIDIASTQWYLTMTADLLREASARFELYAFQEVCHD
jgi:integrase/recombinase XerD